MQRHFLRHLTDLGKFVEEFWKHQILEDIDGALALLAQIHRDLEGREFVSSLRLQLQQLGLQRFHRQYVPRLGKRLQFILVRFQSNPDRIGRNMADLDGVGKWHVVVVRFVVTHENLYSAGGGKVTAPVATMSSD
ncbi:hypothetical protein D3C80_1424200 [compost metagenome]